MLKDKEILLCAATGWEDKSCQAGLRNSGHSDAFLVLRTGMGLVNARVSLSEYLMAAYSGRITPRLIISTGFAGAITPSTPELYSWVSAERVFFKNREAMWTIFPGSISGITKCTMVSLPGAFKQNDPVPEILTPYSGPKAVDMESASLAEVAKEHQIPFMILRLVTDTPGKPMPHFLYNLSVKFFSGEKINLPAELARDPLGVLQTRLRLRESSRLLQTGWTKFAPEVAHFVERPGVIRKPLKQNELAW